MKRQISLLLALLALPGAASATPGITTIVTNDLSVARDAFQLCDNASGSWVCTAVHLAPWAGQFYGETFLAFDANQDGRVGFVAIGPSNLQCEPDDAAPNGWTCAELLAKRAALCALFTARVAREHLSALLGIGGEGPPPLQREGEPSQKGVSQERTFEPTGAPL